MNIIQDKILIERSSKNYIDNLLNKHPGWKILDIGCGYTAHEKATVVCDVQDLSHFYKNKNFVKLETNNLPFKDKEFDFVIASHVIEHVEDFPFYKRIAKNILSRIQSYQQDLAIILFSKIQQIIYGGLFLMILKNI